MFWKKPKPELKPQWLIVGLGNPGAEYRGTRHNVGFALIDLLSEMYRLKLDKSRHRSRFGIGRLGETVVALAKPLTYMNLSGQAVAPLARDFGVGAPQILVIADDLDLPLGKLRLREGGSAGGHNGHKSLIQHLKTQEYPRIKIGIGNAGRGDTIDHVLSDFLPQERGTVESALRAAAEACVAVVNSGVLAAQQVVDQYNRGT